MTQADKFIAEFKALGLDPSKEYYGFEKCAHKLAEDNRATKMRAFNWENIESKNYKKFSKMFKWSNCGSDDPMYIAWFPDGSVAAIEDAYDTSKECVEDTPRFIFHVK